MVRFVSGLGGLEILAVSQPMEHEQPPRTVFPDVSRPRNKNTGAGDKATHFPSSFPFHILQRRSCNFCADAFSLSQK